MQPELTADTPKLGKTIASIGQTLAELDPGALADLRRMSLAGDEVGAPYFWRLAARHNFPSAQLQTWARIVQIMAVLTDKGASENKRSSHAPRSETNAWRGLGHVLCDGGDLSWGHGESDPRPVLSELRFARLLASRGEMRAELMERTARALAAKKPPGAQINCTDLARFLLYPDDPEHGRTLARDYYARHDRAGRNDNPSNNDQATGEAA